MGRKHDELFKYTFSNPRYARDALRNLLPAAIAACLDWSTLQVMPGTFVDEALRSRHSDQLYSVQVAGHKALIYVLCEHQSRSDPLMPLRVLEYLVRIWRRMLRDERARAKRGLPPIIPIVVYNGKRGWTAPRSLTELYDIDKATLDTLRPWLPESTFLLQDLTKADGDWFEAFSATVALMLGGLKHSHTRAALATFIAHAVPLFRVIDGLKEEQGALEAFFRYAMSADLDREALKALVVDQLGPSTQEVLMTAADRLREEGREEARAAALAEALDKARSLAMQLLALRFGKLDDDVQAQVSAFDIDRLDALNAELADPAFEPTTVDAALGTPAESLSADLDREALRQRVVDPLGPSSLEGRIAAEDGLPSRP